MNELVRIENTEQSFSEDWSPATRPLLIVLTAVICLVGFLGESFFILLLTELTFKIKLIRTFVSFL